MVEILAPAGNLENLIVAVNSGANAVYLGLNNFSARMSSQNFDEDSLKYAISYAHLHGVKVYVALNTLVKNNELSNFFKDFITAYNLGADAFILQDIFLGKYIKDRVKNAVLHLSTQAGVCNEYGAILAKEYGFSRVILSRETSLIDIEKISKIIETEVFIQGALCTCFSGHCYFSSFIGGNSGNRGYCKQPCRKKYKYLVNDKLVKEGYLLSLSDLSVGDKIKKLIELGVVSFKIEGRMRSSEYVQASIQYYKNILSDKSNDIINNNLNNLKKTFNRGDYTKGITFNDFTSIISPKIQSHKGLKIGNISKIINDNLILNTKYPFSEGDSFKIIRKGYEVGNAVCVIKNGKTLLKFKGDAKIGDDVNLTKDISLLNNVNKGINKKQIEIFVSAKLNGKLILKFNDLSKTITVSSNNNLQLAKSQPLSKDEVISNLNKTDKFPFVPIVNFEDFDENVFILKSELNKLRTEFYSKLFYQTNDIFSYNISDFKDFSILNNSAKNIKTTNQTACIVDKFFNLNNSITDVIYIVNDVNYFNLKEVENYSKNYRVWLYLPPFLNSNDLNLYDKIISNFYGVYGEGYWSISYANAKNLKLFIGTGFNVFNNIALNHLKKLGFDKICLSKELSNSEINNLDDNCFILSCGNLQIMDLIYCPFNKQCSSCEINDRFILQDEENRNFLVKRYKVSDCRFNVYNCVDLLNSYNFNNKLFDFTLKNQKQVGLILNSNYDKLNEILKSKTNGNSIKGIK